MEFCLLTTSEVQILSLSVSGVILSRPVNVVFRVNQKLLPMSNPSNNSWDGEKNWVHVSREAHSSVYQTRVEVNVRVEFSADEIFIRKSYLF